MLMNACPGTPLGPTAPWRPVWPPSRRSFFLTCPSCFPTWLLFFCLYCTFLGVLHVLPDSGLYPSVITVLFLTLAGFPFSSLCGMPLNDPRLEGGAWFHPTESAEVLHTAVYSCRFLTWIFFLIAQRGVRPLRIRSLFR